MVSPSKAISSFLTSRMLTSTPGIGRPACVRAADVVASSDHSAIRCWGHAIEASGEVSVIPRPG